jgi:hypothetical protein
LRVHVCGRFAPDGADIISLEWKPGEANPRNLIAPDGAGIISSGRKPRETNPHTPIAPDGADV